jgi:hypothetical protein
MSDEVRTTATRTYKVLPNTPVHLTIEIGNSQQGGTSIMWAGGVTTEPEPVDRAIGGAGEDLRGKVLTCTTTVKDTNKMTNHTSVTYHFTGGAANQDFAFDIDVSKDGGYAVYLVSFVFI